MKRILVYVLGALALVFVAIQIVPVERTNPPVQTEVSAPPEVMRVLEKSCYDCHSHETVWPWYSRVAPVAWWVAHDVAEGREHLNFSTWNVYDERERAHNLEEIVEEVEAGKMPLPKYLRQHPDARVTPEELAILREWARTEGAIGESGSREEDERGPDEAGPR
jgi:hypothetical protein